MFFKSLPFPPKRQGFSDFHSTFLPFRGGLLPDWLRAAGDRDRFRDSGALDACDGDLDLILGETDRLIRGELERLILGDSDLRGGIGE